MGIMEVWKDCGLYVVSARMSLAVVGKGCKTVRGSEPLSRLIWAVIII